jgi:hypothetical protein
MGLKGRSLLRLFAFDSMGVLITRVPHNSARNRASIWSAMN